MAEDAAPTFHLQTWDLSTVAVAQVETVGLRGPLRGVQEIDFARLARARECVVEPVNGGFWVRDPASRNSREGKGDGQYVHLDDPAMDRCYCEDFLQAGGAREDATDRSGEDLGRPCKHILAAVLHHEKHAAQLVPWLTALDQRNSVAAAAKAAQQPAA